MDIRNLKFQNNFFDAIWCNAVIHHILDSDLPKVFGEFKRVLKSNGNLFLSVRYNISEHWDKVYENCSRYFNFFNKLKMESLLSQFGFHITYVQDRLDNDKPWMHLYSSLKK